MSALSSPTLRPVHSIAPYQARRLRLLQELKAQGGGIAFIPNSSEVIRNADSHFPFRGDSYFYYLSQFPEPEAVLVLVALADRMESVLFCWSKNSEREIWDGYRFGPELATSSFAFERGLPLESLETEMVQWLAHSPQIFYPLNAPTMTRFPFVNWLDKVRAQGRSGVQAPSRHIDIRPLVDEMRLHKDGHELGLMQEAASISAQAHVRAMRHCKVGMHEYELEAELLHEFRRQGAEGPAYGSIVGTGANSCILHYRAGASVLQEGDMVLIDAGCEYQGYAGDITRTFPANGRFSAAQRDLYECVLAAQIAAIDATRVGRRFTDPHEVALRILVQGMFDFGLLQTVHHGGVDEAIEKKHYQRFYMHRTSHWLGLDVHDVGRYVESPSAMHPTPVRSRDLAPAMVLTIEPGLYVRPADDVPKAYWDIGIRIEDDVYIDLDGPLVLSHGAPKTVVEIEALMQA